MVDILSILASRLGIGDPEGQGAAAASSAMEPAVTAHFQGLAQDALDWSARQQAMQQRLHGLPLAQQLADPEYKEQAMNVALGFGPGAMRSVGGLLDRAIGFTPKSAPPALPETVVPSLSQGEIASRLGPAGKIGPLRDVGFGEAPISSTPGYQTLGSSQYGSGNAGSWVGRSSRFGDEDLGHTFYNPRYDEGIYPGGQTRPAGFGEPPPEHVPLDPSIPREDFTVPNREFPYGPETLRDAFHFWRTPSRYTSQYPRRTTEEYPPNYQVEPPVSYDQFRQGAAAPPPYMMSPAPLPAAGYTPPSPITTMQIHDPSGKGGPTEYRYSTMDVPQAPTSIAELEAFRENANTGLMDMLRTHLGRLLTKPKDWEDNLARTLEVEQQIRQMQQTPMRLPVPE